MEKRRIKKIEIKKQRVCELKQKEYSQFTDKRLKDYCSFY